MPLLFSTLVMEVALYSLRTHITFFSQHTGKGTDMVLVFVIAVL